LAPTYAESAVTRPFPVSNGYYPEEQAPRLDEDRYKLVVDGLVASKQALDARAALRAAAADADHPPRLRRGFGAAIGKWTGAPLKDFLVRIGADLTAKYVHFACAEGYFGVDRHATALHPQTQMTFKFDGQLAADAAGLSPAHPHPHQASASRTPSYVVGLAVLNNLHGRLLGG